VHRCSSMSCCPEMACHALTRNRTLSFECIELDQLGWRSSTASLCKVLASICWLAAEHETVPVICKRTPLQAQLMDSLHRVEGSRDALAAQLDERQVCGGEDPVVQCSQGSQCLTLLAVNVVWCANGATHSAAPCDIFHHTFLCDLAFRSLYGLAHLTPPVLGTGRSPLQHPCIACL
jgi:hypothetical protein